MPCRRRLRAGLVCAALLSTIPASARAQGPSGPPGRMELGLHVAWMRQSDLDTMPAGLGGRVTFDVSRWIGLEAELTAFPKDDFSTTNATSFVPEYTITTERSRLSGFFGPRAGVRNDRFGVFALARPGFTRVKAGDVRCDGPGCAIILIAQPTYRTEFAFDYGAAFELYFPSGATLRAAATDTVIRHRSLAPPCTSCTTHNVTVRGGIGVRF